MRGFPAKPRLRQGLFLAFALIASASLTGCSDIDSALFGDDSSDVAANVPAPAPTSDNAFPPSTVPPASSMSVPSAPPSAMSSNSNGLAPVATVTPVAIAQGNDTGTAVNKTIQSIRGQIAGLQQKIASNSARLAELRNRSANAAEAYQQSKARITARLQIGTTRGNPELVAEWNSAQSSLDALSGNINALNALGTDVTNDTSGGHFALDQISATFNVSGAVDEDHRQLSLLEDETSQTIELLDRLVK
jgi:hypothetical protein